MNAAHIALPFLAAAALTAAEQPPNVVLLLVDDLGYGSLSCYGASKDLVQMPTIDRLAAEGVRCTMAHTPASVCSPTRYGLLTGRYAWRTVMKKGVLNHKDPLLVETTRPTIAGMLKAHGYATAVFGKWHLGLGSAGEPNYTEPLNAGPLEVGFDHWFGLNSNHGDLLNVWFEDRAVIGLRSKELKPYGSCYYGDKPFVGLDAPQRVDTEVGDTIATRAAAWIAAQAKDKPFFCYVPTTLCHEPLTPSPATAGKSRGGPFVDVLHDLERTVATLVESLERSGQLDRTLFILTSDNGGTSGANAKAKLHAPIARAQQAGLKINGDLAGSKGGIDEGGFRVPFIARWPGHIPASSTCAQEFSLVDVLPTLAVATGAARPDGAAPDGVDVWPALTSSGAVTRPPFVEHSANGEFALRDGTWKWRAKDTALFDLKRDSHEKSNVAKQHPERAKQMAAELARIRAQTH